MKKSTLLLIAATMLTSCITRVKYNELKINLSTVKTKTVDLALIDHRTIVLDHSVDPNFIGYMRGSYGIPYPLAKEGDKSFIDDLSGSISNSLKNSGINATEVLTTWESSEQEVKKKLFTLTGEKKLLFVFKELHSDGYGIQLLYYKIDVSVYDKTGNLLIKKPFEGTKELGGNVMFGAGSFGEYIPQGMTKLLEEIFQEKEVLEAINKI